MNILMFTNTYMPHVGGVARSVHMFAEAYRELGHDVLVVAPEFDGEEDDPGVMRVPAIQNFNGSDFSVRLPSGLVLTDRVHDFKPDVIHAHHPFLLGCNAATLAAMLQVPLVYTHHTMYEDYTHYVSGDSAAMRSYAINLTTGFANVCAGVIAPSESIRRIDMDRGVTTEIRAISSGVDVEAMQAGDGAQARQAYGIPADAYVIGHVGRLAEEKNLGFLARAVCGYLATDSSARFLVVGDGTARAELADVAAQLGVAEQLIETGSLGGTALADAYRAMDLFVFASLSETQGMVVAESMAAGVPVLAVDANGVRDVVVDGQNGRLLMEPSEAEFGRAIEDLRALTPSERALLVAGAQETAEGLSVANCTAQALNFYQDLVAQNPDRSDEAPSAWEQALSLLEEEWLLMENRLHAASKAIDTMLKEDDEDA